MSPFLYTFKWFQIWLNNNHNLTSVICLCLVCSIWPIDRSLSDATTSESQWIWEQFQWKGTPISPNLQCWSQAIKLFNVISRTLVGWILPVCRNAVGVFYPHCWLDWMICLYKYGKCSHTDQYVHILKSKGCIFGHRFSFYHQSYTATSFYSIYMTDHLVTADIVRDFILSKTL